MKIKSIFSGLLLTAISTHANVLSAKVEVVTPDLINQYQLDFSNIEARSHELIVASADLVTQQVKLVAGALYLKDNSTNQYELISKTASGQAAILTKLSGVTELHEYSYGASDDWQVISYSSDNANIVTGDVAGTTDVFVYHRSSGLTERVEGNSPHDGNVYEISVSQSGSKLSFTSSDLNFGITPVANDIYSLYEITTYIYDIQSQSVPVPVAANGDGGAMLPETNAFSADESSLLVTYPSYDEIWSIIDRYHWSIHDIANTQSKYIGTSQDCSGSSSPLTSVVNLGNLWAINKQRCSAEFGGPPSSEKFVIYDQNTGEVVDNPIDGVWEKYISTSIDKRYSIFSSTRTLDPALGQKRIVGGKAEFDNTSGTLWVHDNKTGQWRHTFMPTRYARGYYYSYYSNIADEFDSCSYLYIEDSEFEQTNKQACSTYEITGRTMTDGYDVITDNIPVNSIDAYQLTPSGLKFHNDNKYITIEANSWYLDETIPNEEFSIPYARDVFVTANPFANKMINIDGTPVIDRASETGLYVWRNQHGQIVVKAVAGDPAQSGDSTLFSGAITSGDTLTGLVGFSIEANDMISQSATNQIIFAMHAKAPWEDRFVFMANATQSLCVELNAFEGGLFLGPDKVQVDSPYDVINQTACETPGIAVDGKPTINRTVDKGIFVWTKGPNNWQVEVVSGNRPRTVGIDVVSDQAITNVVPLNIEASDVFTIYPKQLFMNLNVMSPWMDGFKFSVDGSASNCLSTRNNGVPIYVGPNRVELGKSVDLITLTHCQ